MTTSGMSDLVVFTADIVFQQSFQNADVAYGLQYRQNDVSQGEMTLRHINVRSSDVVAIPILQDGPPLDLLGRWYGALSIDQTVYAAFAEASLAVNGTKILMRMLVFATRTMVRAAAPLTLKSRCSIA